MARYITYNATRSLISGRTAGTEVTLDLDNLLASLDRQAKNKASRKRSIGGRSFITFERQWDTFKCRTIPLANTDAAANLLREFLDSGVDQVMDFAPGAEYDGAASPAVVWSVELVSVGGESRTRIGPSGDRFSFQFTLEEVVE